MRVLFIVFASIVLLISCTSENQKKVDVSGVDISMRVDRFEQEFYDNGGDNLKELRTKYPFLFPGGFTDSIALEKISNIDEVDLFSESQKVFKDFSEQELELKKLFQHIKYYNSDFKAPKIVTLLTNIDYDNRVILTNELLLISLDAYLGSNHPFYQNFPSYIRQNNTKERLVVDVANTFVSQQVSPVKQRSFVAKMVIEGKKLFLLDKYLPEVNDAIKIGYSSEKFNWAIDNEQEIWAFFIENELLFSTKSDLNKRFLETAPFSKFYAQTDNRSPGRIGAWIGWQIVRSYHRNNDVSLQEILRKDPIKLFEESNYKPRK